MAKSILTVLSLLVFGACANAQPSDAERSERITANLKHQIPQIAELDVTMGPIEDSGIDGLQSGSFTVRGQEIKFLVTSDDTKFFLLASDVLDVSMSLDELAAAKQEQENAVTEAAMKRSEALNDFADSLPMRGNPDAPVTIVEFSDFQCPYCARVIPTVDQVLEKREGEVRVAFAHFPLPNHPWAKPAAVASSCAGEQDQDAFWVLHDNYFEHQKSITPANVIEKSRGFLAGSAIDMDAWSNCATNTESAEYKDALAGVEAQLAAGTRNGVSGTPGFFVNGAFINGAQSLAVFEDLIDKALATMPN